MLEKTLECSPFVKWAGGKTQLVKRLKLPREFHSYYEPFLGGGAVFFHLATTVHTGVFRATLSDTNSDLILTYRVVRDKADELIKSLFEIQNEFRKLELSEKPGYYYEKRSNPPDPKDAVARATWFIFLNKTAYNGLYRVNRKGIFNVPYGDYPNATLCDPGNLRSISVLLSRKEIEIKVSDYAAALTACRAGDFVYLDPPYFPVGKSGFTDYTTRSFGEKDQRKLALVFKDLTMKECMVLLSNSEAPLIRKLYSGGLSRQILIEKISAFRMINSVGSKRSGVVELLIRNYA